MWGAGLPGVEASGQGVDCARLQAAIQARVEGADVSDRDVSSGAAGRQRIEIQRTQAYADGIGCGSRQFNDFDDEPPQCAAIASRLQRMQGNLAQLESQAQRPGQDMARRAALIARYDASCRFGGNPADLAQSHGGSFYPDQGGNPTDLATVPVDPDDLSTVPLNGDISSEPKPRSAGQALCVRSCDGGYFPMNTRASQDQLAGLDQLCKASCPNTEAHLYTTASGTDLASATSIDGTPYTSLPAAFRFEKTFDASCTCKPPNQSWAQALAEAEKLLGAEHKGDVTVTAKMSAELSKASPLPRNATPVRGKRGAPPPAVAESDGPVGLRGSHGPAIDPTGTVPGVASRTVQGRAGSKKPVRVIAP